jgi:hypothetical protein
MEGCAGFMSTVNAFDAPCSVTEKSAAFTPLSDWLNSDHAPVGLPHLDDTVVEPLSCLFDCRGIIGAIDDRWRSGDVIVRG